MKSARQDLSSIEESKCLATSRQLLTYHTLLFYEVNMIFCWNEIIQVLLPGGGDIRLSVEGSDTGNKILVFLLKMS